MRDEHRGFVIDIKRPTREGYAACLVITPTLRDGGADVDAKFERNVGMATAIQLATELLGACGASDDLLSQVQALATAPGETGGE